MSEERIEPEGANPTERLLRELDQVKRERAQTAAEAEAQRRHAQALGRMLMVVVEAGSLDEFLHRLLSLFIQIAHVDVAVLRLREGDRFRSRASIGLEEEVHAGFSIPAGEGIARRVATQTNAGCDPVAVPEAIAESLFMQKKGVRALCCMPLRDRGDVVGLVYMASHAEHDLSNEQRHLLRALAAPAAAAVAHHVNNGRLLRSMERAVRVRDEMLGIVAHDLRNPLGVISMAAHGLSQRLADPSVRRSIDRIVRSAQRATRLIQDLLDISAIEAGRFSVERRTIEVADVLLAAIESQQSLASAASIILASDVSPELPAVEADDERLLEVLENLLGNAIKFTGRGGTITVGATRRSGDGDVVISVKDNGTGIAAEQIPHLFDRFWQGKKDRRGVGLGLPICKAIVEAHGGRIWVDSAAGAGTTVSFTIPAAAAQAPRSDSGGVANILIVDDRPENLLALQAILERPEYRLVTATSGDEALRLALREHFSVALVDVAMPGMDGFEVATHLKTLERSRDIPIIFITAFGDDPKEIHRAYEAGGADYLVKPLDTEIVRKKVAVFVDLYRRRYQTDMAPSG